MKWSHTRLFFLFVGCLVQFAAVVSTNACTDKAWCQNFKHFCTNTQYRPQMVSDCPVSCGTCPKPATPRDIRCSTNNGGCQHICTIKENAVKCVCNPGWKLDANGKNCSDINECQGVNPCANDRKPHCVNEAGGYHCAEETCSITPGLFNRYKSSQCCKDQRDYPCGRDSPPGLRIVGGKNAQPGGWPWVVYILIDGKTLCGGTLIDENWVMTAGHCFLRATTSSSIKLFFGRLKPAATKQDEPWVQERVSIRYILHPKYNKKAFPYYDIALIQLNKPVVMGEFVHKACLPNGERPKVGTTCWAVGYGTVAYRGKAAEILQEVDLPIVSHESCIPVYASTNYPLNTKTMFCAGHAAGGKDACQGDSGGPFVCQRCDSCAFYVAGVTSFGKGCARAGVYGVYTDVEKFEEWISQETGIPVSKNKTCGVKQVRWSLWSSWSQCSATCGGGRQNRTRQCFNGSPGDPNCIGSASGERSCGTPTCPYWGQYGEWSDCSASCGGGNRNRNRTCLGGDVNGCKGRSTETEPCNTNNCPSWSQWGSWSECSVTCGGGDQTAKRTCAADGVKSDACSGIASKSRGCKTNLCPFWTQWTSWSECSKSCGGGKISRSRSCRNGNEGEIGCDVGSTSEAKACNEQPCGDWRPWSAWSSCTATCGGGKQTASRECAGGTAGQDGCPGNSQQKRACNTESCPVWSTWSRFGDCSVTCNGGVKTRTRTCENGSVGEKGCEGSTNMTMECNTNKCPFWTKWSPWKSCSKTCGGGIRSRTRSCSYGIVGDNGCEGNTTATEPCNENKCPTWGSYSQWTACSVSCGGGEQSRTKPCLHGTVGQQGCQGSASETRPCETTECPTWSTWGPWSSCSQTCGTGQSTTSRKCMRGSQKALDCEGQSNKSKRCKLADCPGVFGPWTTWSDCSVTCGTGSQSRERKCIESCSQNDTDSKECTRAACPVLSEWSEWSSCSVSCGTGVKRRNRTCTMTSNPSDCNAPLEEERDCFDLCWGEWSSYSQCSVSCGPGGIQKRKRTCLGKDANAPGCSETDTKVCGEPCPSHWGDWSKWSTCTYTCNGGTRRRTRVCVKQTPQSPQCSPASDGSEEKLCNEQECPDNCKDGIQPLVCQGYKRLVFGFCTLPSYNTYVTNNCKRSCGLCNILPGPWSKWSSCNKSCGGGITTRRRSCRDRRGCNGALRQSRSCNTDSCQGFTQWSAWTKCSQTCGGGERSRSRSCPTNIECQPDANGLQTTQSEACQKQPCPGRWSEWSKWSDCSKTCGRGQRSRDRKCIGGTAGGPGCPGRDTQTRNCKKEDCPGKWGQWTAFGSCNASCGPGKQVETRTCQGGQAGGPGCRGSGRRLIDCNVGPCITTWGDWSSWGSCNSSCGGGKKVRTRNCQHGNPGDVGCEGASRESATCNEQACKAGACSGLSDAVNRQCVKSWCGVFIDYMERNCKLTCCKVKHTTGTGVRPACADNAQYRAANLCSSALCYMPAVRQNCKQTCGRC